MSTCKVDNQGRMTIPAKWRDQHHVSPGSELVVLEEDGKLLILTREQAIQEAQEIVRASIRPGISLVEEVMQDRRREVAREQDGRKRRASKRRE